MTTPETPDRAIFRPPAPGTSGAEHVAVPDAAPPFVAPTVRTDAAAPPTSPVPTDAAQTGDATAAADAVAATVTSDAALADTVASEPDATAVSTGDAASPVVTGVADSAGLRDATAAAGATDPITGDAASAVVAGGGVATPPRIRWAGIVWGAFFTALAVAGLWLQADGSRRDAAARWIVTAEPPTFIAVAVLAVGIVLLVAGIAGMLRRAQHRSTPSGR
jgi:hypothetical protein